MLSKKKRQEYLKYLGFYTGSIDGIEGTKTKAAYKALQNEYFTRAKDLDGKYGKNTDILLQNAYNVKKNCKSFKLSEFKCSCKGKYCTGYPTVINGQLLINLQAVRDKFGATTVTSGMRCSKYNSSLKGSSALSRHKSGKAVDIKNTTSATVQGRKSIMAFWKTLKGQRYTYCNINGSHPNMGSAVHIDVK